MPPTTEGEELRTAGQGAGLAPAQEVAKLEHPMLGDLQGVGRAGAPGDTWMVAKGSGSSKGRKRSSGRHSPGWWSFPPLDHVWPGMASIFNDMEGHCGLIRAGGPNAFFWSWGHESGSACLWHRPIQVWDRKGPGCVELGGCLCKMDTLAPAHLCVRFPLPVPVPQPPPLGMPSLSLWHVIGDHQRGRSKQNHPERGAVFPLGFCAAGGERAAQQAGKPWLNDSSSQRQKHRPQRAGGATCTQCLKSAPSPELVSAACLRSSHHLPLQRAQNPDLGRTGPPPHLPPRPCRLLGSWEILQTFSSWRDPGSESPWAGTPERTHSYSICREKTECLGRPPQHTSRKPSPPLLPGLCAEMGLPGNCSQGLAGGSGEEAGGWRWTEQVQREAKSQGVWPWRGPQADQECP